MKTITFYRNNRIDSPFKLSETELISKFADWQELHRLEWPLDRQIGLFLTDVGSFDKSDRETIFDILQ